MRNVETNALIDKANRHNEYCREVIEEVCREPNYEAVFKKLYRENLELGIELCCQMREAGLDAYVDRITCAVVDGKQVDLTEMIEGEGLRYMAVEYVKEEA